MPTDFSDLADDGGSPDEPVDSLKWWEDHAARLRHQAAMIQIDSEIAQEFAEFNRILLKIGEV